MNRWQRYVARLTKGESQVQVAERTGLNQTTIGRWREKGLPPGIPGDVARFAQVYGGNVLEAFVAAGYITEAEAGTPPAPATFVDLVDNDPDLSEESKGHLINQYGLLKAATAHSRALSLREEIEQNPNLDDETRRALLARLDGMSEASATDRGA